MYPHFTEKIPFYWQKGKARASHFWSELQVKNWTRRELVILFSLACVLGMASKAIAVRTVTIGYQDYLITEEAQSTPGPITSESLRGPVCEE